MKIKSVKVKNGRAKVGDKVIAPNYRRNRQPAEGVIKQLGRWSPGKHYIILQGETEPIGAWWFVLVDPPA